MVPEQLVFRVGEERTIRLPGLSAAGYEWSVEIADGDRDAVAVAEVGSDGPAGPPGTSVEHVFTVSGRRPGEAVLRFEQRRSWEDDVAPHDTRTFRVTVEA